MNKGSKTRGGRLFSLIISCIILIGSAITIYFCVIKPASNSEAFSPSQMGSCVAIGELLNDPTTATGNKPFSASVKTLVNMIYGAKGDAASQVSELKSQLKISASETEPKALTAKDLRAKTYYKSADQSIVVRLGGLDWIVTYVSTDTSGNLIATLWLSNSHQDAWGWNGTSNGNKVSDEIGWNKNLGKYYGFVNGGLYSDWAADWRSSIIDQSYIAGLYGTSYIRVETLNNPVNRQYAIDNDTFSEQITQVKTLADHPFALYTVSDFGLTNYITTPDQMKWMTNRQNPTKGLAQNYWRNSESLTASNDYGYVATAGSNGWYEASEGILNFESKTGYANWGKDYLWLPSLAEIGCDETDGGLWETVVAERASYDGVCQTALGEGGDRLTSGSSQKSGGTRFVSASSWCRSMNNTAALACNVSLGGNYASGATVDQSIGVRPAFLFNLGLALEHVETSNAITINFDKAGGIGGHDLISTTVKLGATLPSILVPKCTGYTFTGYYTAVNGGGSKLYDAGGRPMISVIPSVDITLFAMWEPITYKISYKTDYGSGTMADSTCTYDVALNLTPNAFTYDGRIFEYWYCSSTGKKYDDGESVMNLSSTQDDVVILTARWTYTGIYTITFDNQSATTSGTTSVSATNRQAMPSITAPTKTGYIFGGYYTSTNGGGTKIYNADGTPAISSSTFTANTTLYAYWTDWYKITMTGSTTAYETYYSNDEEYKFISLTITPTAGHIISQISFDNTNWYSVEYIRYDIGNTTMAVNVAYYANENSNSLVLEFKGLMTSNLINIYTKTTAGSYSGLKIAGGGNVDGVAVQSTYGGVAMVVGANFAEMTDDDYIICSTMAIDNYEFMYWMDSAGNKLSFDESVKFKKKDVYGSIITAVFAPVGTDPNTYFVVDNSE